MKIKMQQFFAKNHSWSVVGQGLARGFKSAGHNVEIFSTNGIELFPDDLKENIIGYVEENKPQLYGRAPSGEYDMQFSYTSMKNFPMYLLHGNKNRIGLWCYEWPALNGNTLPTGFAKHHISCDWLCPPSEIAKRVFIEAKISAEKMKVIPHGIVADDYRKTTTLKLPTNKKFKIGVVLGQNHKRKNIPGMLKAYGEAFTNKDDVCLIIKGKEKQIANTFDVSLMDCLNNFNKLYPKHAELKIMSDFIIDMSNFYRSIDATYTMSHTESFYLCALESMASGKLSIAPNWGGQVDFLNSTNSLLIEGKETRADPSSMYWEQRNNAIWFQPSIDDAVDKLRYAYNNFEIMNSVIEKDREKVYEKYDWSNISKQYLDLCKAV